MVVAGHNDEGEERVSLVGEMKKCVADNSRLLRVLEMGDGALMVEQVINKLKHEFVFLPLPLFFGQCGRTFLLFEFVAVFADLCQS